jgi:hypothetical protein
MGKRIKWLNDVEAEQIRNGVLDYTLFFSIVHMTGDDGVKFESKDEMMYAFHQIEATRLQALKFQSSN